uniref:Uncharacterized protein n=2 Tax=Corethron hystrix TaxID=216773 RepID=A0A7S1FWC6_9STRA|mmetsp:Transcript_37224/g.86831  ORF Transcript_37224/g.86831 Transcript_37224/m.86831 type:complete len:523 (+) Transcript_37224:655-2223(+)
MDRTKIFLIFITVTVACFLQPVLVCLMADGHLGSRATWSSVLIPLWSFDVLLVLLCMAAIASGPTPLPDDLADWVDPSPMSARFLALSFVLMLSLFEIFLALKLDDVLEWNYASIFAPLFFYKALDLLSNWSAATVRIVTLQSVEDALGGDRTYDSLSEREKDKLSKKYLIVPDVYGPEFEYATVIQSEARAAVSAAVMHAVLLVLVVLHLDQNYKVSWGVIFLPVWIYSFGNCCSSFLSFSATHRNPGETFFAPENLGGDANDVTPEQGTDKTEATATNSGEGGVGIMSYGATNISSEGDVRPKVVAVSVAMEEKISGGENSDMTESSIGNFTSDLCSSDKMVTSNPNQNSKDEVRITQQGAVVESACPPEQSSTQDDEPIQFTDEENEKMLHATSQALMHMCGTCCSQIIWLVIVGLFVGKLDGAEYSSFWIIFPLCVPAAGLLCCTGYAVYSVQNDLHFHENDEDIINQQDLETGLIDETSPQVNVIPGNKIDKEMQPKYQAEQERNEMEVVDYDDDLD